MKQIYEDLATVLQDVWYNIAWDKIKGRRIMSMWGEFEGQLKIRARQHSSFSCFISSVCTRFGSHLSSEESLRILNKYKGKELLDVVRNKVQILMLILKLKRENKAIKFNERKKKGKNEL